MGKEPHGVPVLRAAFTHDDLDQIGREVGFRNSSLENVLPRPAGVEYRRNRHGFGFSLLPQ